MAAKFFSVVDDARKDACIQKALVLLSERLEIRYQVGRLRTDLEEASQIFWDLPGWIRHGEWDIPLTLERYHQHLDQWLEDWESRLDALGQSLEHDIIFSSDVWDIFRLIGGLLFRRR